ncbi:trans-sialidase, putative [Trypanosoma cruzi marinkellei]|uniref:Trans-sialidase, putative n=1 Tax=Trypanosoma cruzi marinkellei TaxID=85056 RepID=K2MP32_TRYCR|nr:trans-sialidase, putative [Trypanosoma cruzi marinkellei]
MLSRVAAVTAPRTHNRRRMTGSSGRRREGRESERQRPNMSRHLFYSAVLLFLVAMTMCCNTGQAEDVRGSHLCQESSTKHMFEWRDTTDKEAVGLLRVPSLVEMNGDVFAVAQAQCTRIGEECQFTGIASGFLDLGGGRPKEELVASKMKTQVLEKCPFATWECPLHTTTHRGTESLIGVHLSRPTTVVKGSDIYMLAGNYIWIYGGNDKVSPERQWGILLVKGNFSEEDESKKESIGMKLTLSRGLLMASGRTP